MVVARIKIVFGVGASVHIFCLSAAARTQGQITDLRQYTRQLHPVQLRHERHQFRDKLIFHQFTDFFLAVAFAARKQVGYGDFERACQPFQ